MAKKVWRDDYYLVWHGKEIFTRATARNRGNTHKACKLVKAEAKRSLLAVASAPGMPPAFRTGRLYRAIHYVVQVKHGIINGFIGPRYRKKTPHGLWLELGTQKMRARPFMRPALRKLQGRIRSIFKNQNLDTVDRFEQVKSGIAPIVQVRKGGQRRYGYL